MKKVVWYPLYDEDPLRVPEPCVDYLVRLSRHKYPRRWPFVAYQDPWGDWRVYTPEGTTGLCRSTEVEEFAEIPEGLSA